MRNSNMFGRSIRLARIVNPKTEKTVIVAVDHGLAMRPVGIENPLPLVKKVLEGGPDALLLNSGMIKLCHRLFVGKDSPALILRLDWAAGWRKEYRPKKDKLSVIFSVEDALRLGADAVLAYLYLGPGIDTDLEARNVEWLGKIERDCERFGVPLVVEAHASPLAEEQQQRDPALLALLVRAAAEIGADLIKTEYTGIVETFREVVKSSPIPVTALGGPKMPTDEAVLETVEAVMRAGAAGVTFGRNVWQHRTPTGMLNAVKAIVHNNASVDEALKLLKSL
ncbi:MAG: fructose-bisphosphate aldolase [Methanobacteriota archaeon]|nr:MAG: fructose-bisphosphate aldolase [Euryarchaeota archaeon]